MFRPGSLFTTFRSLTFRNVTRFPFYVPSNSAKSTPFRHHLISILTRRLFSSTGRNTSRVFNLLNLNFALQFSTKRRFIYNGIMLTSPTRTTLIPRERHRQRTQQNGKAFFINRSTRNKIILRLTSRRSTARNNNGISKTRTPLRTLRSNNFIRIPSRRGDTTYSLHCLSRPRRSEASFIYPIRIRVNARVHLSQISSSRSNIILSCNFFGSFVKRHRLRVTIVGSRRPIGIYAHFSRTKLSHVTRAILYNLMSRIR